MFTTVPLDQYTFTVVSHPDLTLVGKQVVVSLPRDPVTLQAERGFYNRTVPAGSLQIDQRIFRHAIGDPASYPTRSDQINLLAQHGGLTVGAIEAVDFAAHRYSFGLFTYVRRDPATGREFEVLDYWVE